MTDEKKKVSLDGTNRRRALGRYLRKRNVDKLSEEEIAKFIRFVKREKGLYLESVAYDDTVKFYLMFASNKYLNMMEKDCKLKYLNDKKEKNLYNQTSYMMRLLHK